MVLIFPWFLAMSPTIEVTALTPESFDSLKTRDGILLENERVTVSCKGIRDMLILTNKRMLLADKQGLTGKKQKYLSIPLDKIKPFQSKLEERLTLIVTLISMYQEWAACMQKSCVPPKTWIHWWMLLTIFSSRELFVLSPLRHVRDLIVGVQQVKHVGHTRFRFGRL